MLGTGHIILTDATVLSILNIQNNKTKLTFSNRAYCTVHNEQSIILSLVNGRAMMAPNVHKNIEIRDLSQT